MDQKIFKQVGNFSWNELMTSDVAGAKAFYSDMFGWEMRDTGEPKGSYTRLVSDGREVGGLMALPDGAEGARPAWGSYVSVDDVDQQIKRAEKLGGKVLLQPRDVPEVGRFAVISDPQGAMLTLITYDENYQG